jgi:hypothetical protein
MLGKAQQLMRKCEHTESGMDRGVLDTGNIKA